MFWYFENTQLRVSATWLFFFGCTWLILENCSSSKEAFVLFFHFHFTSSLGRAFEAYPQKILPYNWCIFFHSCSHFGWHFKCQWQNAGLSEGMIWRAVRIWNIISCSNVTVMQPYCWIEKKPLNAISKYLACSPDAEVTISDLFPQSVDKCAVPFHDSSHSQLQFPRQPTGLLDLV